jgi:hypothetical protein
LEQLGNQYFLCSTPHTRARAEHDNLYPFHRWVSRRGDKVFFLKLRALTIGNRRKQKHYRRMRREALFSQLHNSAVNKGGGDP